jgi:thioredoxin-disulfide reductase
MIYDLIIVGGGPAGITAGIYAARQKLNTLLITKEFGGQLSRKALKIENYPGFLAISGLALAKKLEKHLKKQDIEILIDEVTKVEKKGKNFKVITGSKKNFEARAIIIASGGDPRPLEVPGEKEFIGKGVSYCAICDGALFPNKTLAVIGGGNSGFEAAIYLHKIAKNIYILEAGPRVKADKKNQEIVQRIKKIEVITSAFLKKIEGDKFVKSIVYKDKDSKEEKTLAVEGVFVEIGSQPATSFVKGLVEFNERDEIKVEFETCKTKTPGVFAAGDVNIGRSKQIAPACGEGCKAALAAYEYLQSQNE